ncbi:MAG: GNAT family N-acetyltransferase [Deltaproteobacteria bacterium]|nr:GNAT family N-acetyltransferase [Deltaproteobacteria bacterium]MBW1956211.1 GNAT family N-acetyltransferase [Deltaproteobacteria bacterium]MBW2041070.1 GNAT family N-acetyltransferase [Deltaproteobacteria bacterium]MBW2132218.1 GNAT family N-acetyltransferase [Deltaproteobacteria bacterium]
MRYPKEIILKDGQEAVIRHLEKGDEPALKAFYSRIPDSDRWYMRYDVTDPSVIRKWIDGIGKGTVYSIVAFSGEKIIAHASLHMRGFGCTAHVGRLRIMVLPEYRHKRLGTWMLLDLIQLAMDKGLSELRADFVAGIEDAAIDSAVKLDFFKCAVLEDYVKDPDGNRHHMIIMIKRLHKNWGDF